MNCTETKRLIDAYVDNELDLRGALAAGAFEVYYQPLFDLRTKKISTCEALLRWPHPVRGMISPAGDGPSPM